MRRCVLWTISGMLVLTLIYSDVVIHNIGCESNLGSLPFHLLIVLLKACMNSFAWTHAYPEGMTGEPELVHDARTAHFVTDVATVARHQTRLVLSSNIV